MLRRETRVCDLTAPERKELLELFGSCTVTYETTDARDFDDYSMPVGQWVLTQVKAEEFEVEQGCDAAYHKEQSGEARYKDAHKKAVDEGKALIAGIRDRLRQAELLPEREERDAERYDGLS